MGKTTEQLIWQGMRRRCNNPNVPEYPRYGGRGIAMCERWNSFANFLVDMGPRPSPQHSNKGFSLRDLRPRTGGTRSEGKKEVRYFHDYENEPIGGGNPYHRCASCKRSDPEINGRLEGRSKDCAYRLSKEDDR